MENENNNIIVTWTPASMLEITLNEPDDFLKIRETLTRIGVASRKDQKLLNDVQRRNTIATLLSDWGLITFVTASQAEDIAPLRQIKVIPYKEKSEWQLCPKYNIGNSNKDYDKKAI